LWALWLGDYLAGEWFLAAMPIVLYPHLVLAVYCLLLRGRVTGRPHLLGLLIVVLATVPLYLQPWNPRVVFVRTMNSLVPGTTESEVRRVMAGYLGGCLREAGPQYMPEELADAGATHVMSYRWNETDGRYNSDIAQVYLRDGRVVGTQFLPD
jgi:hypothetical protein